MLPLGTRVAHKQLPCLQIDGAELVTAKIHGVVVDAQQARRLW